MSEPYIGEIRMLGFNFPPVGWANCDGSLIAISQNDTLYNLIGTTYGGDGQNTFALPDLRGRLPIHQSSAHLLAEAGGQETVAITIEEMGKHAHHVVGTSAPATSRAPAGNLLAVADRPIYGNGALVGMHVASVYPLGSGQAHGNMQPFLTVTFAIALFGVYPSQS